MSTTASASSSTASAIGGAQPITNVKDPNVLAAGICAVQQLNAQSNSVYQYQLVSVVSGTQQVVSGTKYTINFLTAPSTTCLNNNKKAPNLSSCPVDLASTAIYRAAVVIQPWLTPSCSVLSLSFQAYGLPESMATYSQNNNSGLSSSSKLSIALGTVVGLLALVAIVMIVVLVIRRRSMAYTAPAPYVPAMQYTLLNEDD